MNDQVSKPKNDPSQDSNQSDKPRLVGTTAGEYEESLGFDVSKTSHHIALTGEFSNHFKSLQWSPDGTSILTSSADNALRSFILPPTLLESPHPHALKPYTTYQLPEPEHATAFYPSYSLSDPSTCLFIASPANLPIRLYSTLGGGVLGSYPFVSATTEAYIAPHSLLFASSDRNHFFAGSNDKIAVFDIARPGEGPVTVMRTGQTRRSRLNSMDSESKSGGGLKGIVSALNVSRDGILAAGTFGGKVGLYDNNGYGEANAVISLHDDSDTYTYGNGVTNVLWDDSGHYLCVAERNSDGIRVLDVRNAGKRLAWLRGRNAVTSQRMGVSLMEGEVWAGGTDGVVRVWQEIGKKEGVVERDWEFDAHGDVANGIGLHPGGSVLATCSGQRRMLEFDEREAIGEEDSDSEYDTIQQKTFDNSLKVWAL